MSRETQFLNEYMVLSILFISPKKFLSGLSILGRTELQFLFLIQLVDTDELQLILCSEEHKTQGNYNCSTLNNAADSVWQAVEQGCEARARVASLNAFYPRFTIFCGKPEELLVSISLSENLEFWLTGEKLGRRHFMTGGMGYPCKWGSRWVGTASWTSVASYIPAKDTP